MRFKNKLLCLKIFFVYLKNTSCCKQKNNNESGTIIFYWFRHIKISGF